MTHFAARVPWLTACTALAALLFGSAWGADEPKKAPLTAAQEAEQHVALAEKTFENFWLDPGQDTFRSRLSRAQGVLIIPISARIAFIFGGQGGRGVLVTRDASGNWGGPAFYTLSYASVGLQLGVQVSEVMILVMSQNAVNSLLSSSVRGGVDAGLAGGPVGTGSQTSFQGDFIGFYRSKVLYAGLNLNGAVLSSNDSWNAAFYGKPINTADILLKHEVSSPKGEALVNQVSAAAAQSAEQQKTAAAEKPAPTKDEKK